jgi:hypothetical protein
MDTSSHDIASSAQFSPVKLTMMKSPGILAEVTVNGSIDAINKLGFAFIDDRLSFPDSCQQTGDEASKSALEYNTAKGALPTDDEVANIITHWKSQGVDIVSNEELEVDRTTTLRNSIQPPIRANGLDIDHIAMMLRVLTKVHGQGRAFEIGIITLNFDSPVYGVDIIPTVPNTEATDMFWLIRRFEYRPSGVGMQETWSTLTQVPSQSAPPASTSVPSNTTTAPTAPTMPAPVAAMNTNFTSSNIPGPLATAMPPAPTMSAPVAIMTTSYTTPTTAAAPSTTVPALALSAPPPAVTPAYPPPQPLPEAIAESDLLVQPGPTTIDTLTDEEIFSGDNIKPEVITGNIILRLSLRYSNKQLADLINAMYVKAEKPKRTDNNFTKRVTLAFETRAAELDLHYPTGAPIPLLLLRKQYDQYRRSKKLRSRKGGDDEYQDKGVRRADRVPRTDTAYARKKRKSSARKLAVAEEGEEGDDVGRDEKNEEGSDGMDFQQMGEFGF